MQYFVDFLVNKLKSFGDQVNVLDCDEHHSLIEATSAHDRSKGNIISEYLLIPLMTRFVLVTEQYDLEPTTGIQVRRLPYEDS